MEVHAHTHTSRKKWTNYFWEFLMLFLAVFAGFLAENRREHYVEHQREESFIHSLIQDLRTDTANLQEYMFLRERKRNMMDSLTMLLSSGLHRQAGNETYSYARQVFNGNRFVSTDGTLQQLKNAGNLRLIRKENAVGAILAYDASVKMLQEWDEIDARVRTTFRELGGQVFKSDIFYHLMDTSMNFLKATGNPQLITADPVIINNISFQIQYISTITLGNYIRGRIVKTNATNLIELLKKEYHLE